MTRHAQAWPFLDIPFTRFGRAMDARRDLLAWFAGAVADARAALDAGQAVPGILGSLVAATDEDGNRCGPAGRGARCVVHRNAQQQPLLHPPSNTCSATAATCTQRSMSPHPPRTLPPG